MSDEEKVQSTAEMLLGRTLDSGWKVVERVRKQPHNSGGVFSCCYIVERDGRKAFLKALDLSMAHGMPDELRVLQAMIDAFQFERRLLSRCAERRMDRVVQAIQDGKVLVSNAPIIGTVYYLVLEPADGDVRDFLQVSSRADLAWIVRCIHHVATGLMQLHTADVAHQDMKPSNILVFGGGTSKVSDLGSASIKGVECPRDNCGFAGDGTYAPPELLYGYFDPEWNRRRLACDIYLLGSVITFFFTGLGMTALTLRHLPETQRPTANPWRGGWQGDYKEILAEVRNAFEAALAEFASQVPGQMLKSSLRDIVRQLCDPDPSLRGHPITRSGIGNPYSLERYVAQFNLIANRLEIGIMER